VSGAKEHPRAAFTVNVAHNLGGDPRRALSPTGQVFPNVPSNGDGLRRNLAPSAGRQEAPRAEAEPVAMRSSSGLGGGAGRGGEWPAPGLQRLTQRASRTLSSFCRCLRSERSKSFLDHYLLGHRVPAREASGRGIFYTSAIARCRRPVEFQGRPQHTARSWRAGSRRRSASARRT
jgi:hypothetical protein